MSPASRPGRGPSGRTAPPPANLAERALPIDLLTAGTPLHRVHGAERDPIFFGPGPGQPPTWRFDSASGRFGVLYVSLSLGGAIVETLLRNPARRMVAYAEISARSSSVLTSDRDLKVVRLYGEGLQQLGADNAISTGPYQPCGLWADALYAHPQAPDGLAYASRYDPGEICIALFQRPDLALSAESPTPLVDQLAVLGALLDRYGKSIADAPRS